MWESILYFYGYTVFFYSLALIISYVLLLILAYIRTTRYLHWTNDHICQAVEGSPFAPGVSIVAPAYNESKTIIDNVNSLLQLDYPNFEVVIVNDGSKDNTLELLIDYFDLEEVPYEYVQHVHSKPFRRLFRSKNAEYHRLTVVDKVNGGTKADAVNAGLNVVRTPYFINTDVDCILSRDAIKHCIFPILQDESIIAVSGTMSMSNGNTVSDGQLVNIHPASKPIPLFQDLEYKRSFLIGKMGWSQVNAMNNVSGGYGLFNTEVVLAAGGYDSSSFAEDMDMITRMIGYCCEQKRPYKVVQIPHTCCWTEGPSSIKVLKRQRIRWGRGLMQHMWKHRYMLFNPKYKRLGMITLPYTLFFELLAPIIEAIGMLMLLFLLFTNGVNWQSFWVLLAAIYIFSLLLSSFVIFFDYMPGGSYKHSSSYLKLVIAAILEPIVYHPLIVFFSIKGYYNYLTKRSAVWGEMTRTGMKRTPAKP
ncbi:MAG: glycosyltransferase family 2 protein [Paludibacteraceae bacterium]|nr:glycosyltransferase family 2 protein [Paludibacteraceae bacterium]